MFSYRHSVDIVREQGGSDAVIYDYHGSNEHV